LQAGLLAPLGLLLGGLGGCIKQVSYETDLRGDSILVPKEKLAEGEGKAAWVVRVRGRKELIYVRRSERGYLAVASRCTHRGCELDIEPEVYICPCHGARFSLQGDVLKGPARRPLRRYPVVESAAGLTIQLGFR